MRFTGWGTPELQGNPPYFPRVPTASSDQGFSLPSATKHGRSGHRTRQLSSQPACAWRVPQHGEGTRHHPQGYTQQQARGAQSQPCTVTARGCCHRSTAQHNPQHTNIPKTPPRYWGHSVSNASTKEIPSKSPVLQGDTLGCPQTGSWDDPSTAQGGGADTPVMASPATATQNPLGEQERGV